MSQYFAYSLKFPNSPPYDKAEHRWASFIGECIRPLTTQFPELLYWTSYYGTTAEFKVYAADVSHVEPHLEAFRQKGFLITPLNRTLEDDLGSDRFIGPKSESTATRRAVLILHSVKCVCDLMADSVYKRDDGYWAQEENANSLQNPIGNHLFSVTHLFHNITAAKARLYPLNDQNGNFHIVPYYTLHNAIQLGDVQLQSKPSPIDVEL